MEPNGFSDVAALLFGTGIIIAFSYERFNRISYDTSRRLERLVSFLTPDKMRARQKVGYAYFIYTLTMVIAYLVLCAYSSVLFPLIGAEGLLPTADIGASGLPDALASATADASAARTGFAPMDGSVIPTWMQGLLPTAAPVEITAEKRDLGIPAEVSMGLALVMIGLAPSIPVLARADEWLRMVAHRMAGIPTWAIEASDSLRANATNLGLGIYQGDGKADPSRAGDYLGSKSDLLIIDKFRAEASSLGNFEDFCLNLEIILVASAWFVEERLYVSAAGDKMRFKDLEQELRRRKTALVNSVKAGVEPADWDLLVSDADALASDFCILIALYNELEVIQPYRDQTIGSPSQRKARTQLNDFVQVLNNDTEPRIRQRFSNLALFWTLSIVMAWTVIWAVLWPGKAEFTLQTGTSQSAYEILLRYTTTALNTYGIAIIVAITLRWVRTMGDPTDQTSKWTNMYAPKSWTRWLPQAFLVLFLAWVTSVTVILAVQIWSSGLLSDNRFDLNLWLYVSNVFEYNAPLCFRAAVLSLLVIILLDARQELGLKDHRWTKLKDKGDLKKKIELHAASERWRELSRRDSWHWAAVGAIVMAAVTVVTRYLTFLAGRGSSTRPFDNIDAGLMIWAVLYASILGALVLFCLSEVFMRQTFRSTSRSTPSPSDNAKPPDAKQTGGPLPEEVAK